MFLDGCSLNSKEKYLKEFNEFVNDIEVNYRNFTSKDWELKELRYHEYVGKYYSRFESKLSDEDQTFIGHLKSSYQLLKIKSKAKNINEKASDGLHQMEGAIDGIKDEIKNKLQ